MAPHFTIHVDVSRSLMRITLAGFFSADDIARFTAARDQALSTLGTAPNEHRTLVDIRGMDIQSQDSVRIFQQVLGDPTKASRRLAFVAAQSLARMQLQRAAEARNAHYFGTVEEAEAFLLE